MNGKTITIIAVAAVAAGLLLTRRKGGPDDGSSDGGGVPLDPFAQSRFNAAMSVVMALPSFLRPGAATLAGLTLVGNSVLIPSGVSYPPGGPVSAGQLLYPLD